jgi:dipeptidyl aminopeptidase/acylaminoacyl peptidase
MKSSLLINLFFCVFFSSYSQINTSHNSIKSTVQPESVNDWPKTERAELSNDGHYFWYTIYSRKSGSTLIIKELQGSKEMTILNCESAIFSEDSKQLFYKGRNDSLVYLNLKDWSTISIARVKEFKIFRCNNMEYLLYKRAPNYLVIQNITFGSKEIFEDVERYLINEFGNTIIVKRKVLPNVQILCLVNLDKNQSNEIFRATSCNISDIIIDDKGKQSACVVTRDSLRTLLYFQNNQIPVLQDSLRLANLNNSTFEKLIRFDKSGNRIFIKFKINAESDKRRSFVMVDVWHFEDIRIQSQQNMELTESSFITAAIDLHSNDLVTLTKEGDELGKFSNNDSMVIVKSYPRADLSEWNWNKFARFTYFLKNTYTQDTKELQLDQPRWIGDDKFIVGWSNDTPGAQNNLMVYNIGSKHYLNITRYIKSHDKQQLFGYSAITDRGLSIASFDLEPQEKGNHLWISDGYDIWRIGITGTTRPINLTRGFGRKNNITFNLIYFNGRPSSSYLKAVDITTKKEGFFKFKIRSNQNPELLSMNPYKIESGFPIKARDAQIFLVKRGSANQSPNFFWSNNLDSFNALTEIYPEKGYNWITAELINWKSSEGKMLQGVIYKPENFNPSKKYPVIFHYYENKSDKIHDYSAPYLSTGDINIPWFVSNGYIVCTPDINYEIGYTGKSALDAIVSCAEYLKKFNWVDAKHMGLDGHSFGSFETNYIISHSNLFAAAVSASGIVDMISDYGVVSGAQSISKKYFFEIHQYRMGTSLWEKPDRFIANSPIFQANKISTPLLMMNNKKDRAVSFSQGIEFFTALRRLGKRVWMLQYDEGAHSLNPSSSEAADYTKRVMQFFDHYLKDSACPKWMLYGIDAKNKGIETGYDLVKEKDPKTGKWLTPQQGGLLTDEEKKKVESLKKRKPLTIMLD